MGQTKLNFELLSSDNAVFACYVTWGSLLMIKVLAMAPFTGIMRMKTKVNSFSMQLVRPVCNVCLSFSRIGLRECRRRDQGDRGGRQERDGGAYPAGAPERPGEHDSVYDCRPAVRADEPESDAGPDAVPGGGHRAVRAHGGLCDLSGASAGEGDLLRDSVRHHHLHGPLLRHLFPWILEAKQAGDWFFFIFFFFYFFFSTLAASCGGYCDSD